MRARSLSGLLKKGDRVAISNITGREASKVSVLSQHYARNVIGGWALGKGGGQLLEVGKGLDIPVFAGCQELYEELPKNKQPNKVIIYSPPAAVYGEVKEVIEYGGSAVQTIYIITEHVSIEVTAKIARLCADAGIDVVGGNTLGVINTHDHVRVGAVGGDSPEEGFIPGSVTIVSNSGNMVNTMATYLQSAGLGTDFGVSTGKDVLILTPLKDLLKLAALSERTKLIVLYVEPGGLYEQEAINWAKKNRFKKPILVYVAGTLSEGRGISLGHAGAVVEGGGTSASGKMKLFDDYFGIEPFDPYKRYSHDEATKKCLARGIRVTTLHHLPEAARMIYKALGWKRDFPIRKHLVLNSWFTNYQGLSDKLPGSLFLRQGKIPEPYDRQFKRLIRESFGAIPARRKMKGASHASSLDKESRMYGYSLPEVMKKKSFGEAIILCFTGELPRYDFEGRIVEMSLMASMTNGPGTISAQAAKLSASAGNRPHTAMIATLAAIGDVHGGNGRRGVHYLIKIFRNTGLKDPYAKDPGFDVKDLAVKIAQEFKKTKDTSKDAGMDYEKIPCLGHPVFRTEAVNYDPRERVIAEAIKRAGKRNVFLDFYHELAVALRDVGAANRVWAVNMDAALACVWLGVCWQALLEKRITQRRVEDCAFLGFAVGRSAGGAGEFLDHQDFGTDMDMRIPASECAVLTKPRSLE